MRPCYFLKSLYPVIKAVNKSMYIWSENSGGYKIFRDASAGGPAPQHCRHQAQGLTHSN